MSISSTRAAAVIGARGFMVEVEAAVTGGMPGLHLYGLPETSLGEVRDRVRAAIFFPVKFICSDPGGRDPVDIPASRRRRSRMNDVMMRPRS